MAIARWRQQRAWALETAGPTNEIRRPRYHEGEDPETQAFVAFRTLTDAPAPSNSSTATKPVSNASSAPRSQLS